MWPAAFLDFVPVNATVYQASARPFSFLEKLGGHQFAHVEASWEPEKINCWLIILTRAIFSSKKDYSLFYHILFLKTQLGRLVSLTVLGNYQGWLKLFCRTYRGRKVFWEWTQLGSGAMAEFWRLSRVSCCRSSTEELWAKVLRMLKVIPNSHL